MVDVWVDDELVVLVAVMDERGGRKESC